MGFLDFFKNKKDDKKKIKEEITTIAEEQNVLDEYYENVDTAYQSPEMEEYVLSSLNEYEKMKREMAPEQVENINIDEVLDKFIQLEEKRFSASCPKNMVATYDTELKQVESQLHLYLQNNDIQALMEKYRETDYTKYSVIDLEQHLRNEPDEFVKKVCRDEQYTDRVVNSMYKNGNDIYEINKRVFRGESSPDKGEWLVTRLMQQNAIENAHYTKSSKKAEVLEGAQMSWASSTTGLKSINVEKAVKEVVSKDFDRGYWVQTELDILTLPLEQKQTLRLFRNQNIREGNYFEPGTLATQYSEATGMSFESGAKK